MIVGFIDTSTYGGEGTLQGTPLGTLEYSIIIRIIFSFQKHGFNLIVQQYNTIFTIDVQHKIVHKRFSQREDKNLLIFIKLLKIENHWFIITNAQVVFFILVIQLLKIWKIQFETSKSCFQNQINIWQTSAKHCKYNVDI